MKVLYWDIDPVLEKEAEENYRTAYALKLKDKDHLTITRALTFDNAGKNIVIADIEKLFSYIESKFLKKPLSGIGVELGAGPGVFSSILAHKPLVKNMYAVELCKSVVENLAPQIVPAIAGVNQNKVINCVGDFNNIKLPDNSVDFILDYFSLHHSKDLAFTLKECYRILKPGGLLLALDKARPNETTNEQINQMLNKEYDDKFKEQFGIPLDIKLTRRMNGEREYRLKQWQEYFSHNGFTNFSHHRLSGCAGRRIPRLIKLSLSILPTSWHIKIASLLSKKKALFDLDYNNRVFISLVDPFPKEISLMIVYK